MKNKNLKRKFKYRNWKFEIEAIFDLENDKHFKLGIKNINHKEFYFHIISNYVLLENEISIIKTIKELEEEAKRYVDLKDGINKTHSILKKLNFS